MVVGMFRGRGQRRGHSRVWVLPSRRQHSPDSRPPTHLLFAHGRTLLPVPASAHTHGMHRTAGRVTQQTHSPLRVVHTRANPPPCGILLICTRILPMWTAIHTHTHTRTPQHTNVPPHSQPLASIPSHHSLALPPVLPAACRHRGGTNRVMVFVPGLSQHAARTPPASPHTPRRRLIHLHLLPLLSFSSFSSSYSSSHGSLLRRPPDPTQPRVDLKTPAFSRTKIFQFCKHR